MNKQFVTGVLLAVLAIVFASQAFADGLATPIVRPDFENRIWKFNYNAATKASGETKGGYVDNIQLTRTIDTKGGKEIYESLDPCQGGNTPCKFGILIAGHAYLSGFSGSKNTLQLKDTSDSTLDFALLTEFIRAEGFGHSVLALFKSNQVMPSCFAPLQTPHSSDAYLYGGWKLNSAQRLNNGNYLVWAKADGGDGGYVWSLQTFLTLTSACKIVRREDYYLTAAPTEKCKYTLPDLDKLQFINDQGSVIKKAFRVNCTKLERTQFINSKEIVYPKVSK
jgi:hypothetical protein